MASSGFNQIDMRIYLLEKGIFTEAARQWLISLLRVDKSSCLPKLRSIPALLYDFLTATFTFVVKVVRLQRSGIDTIKYHT